MIAFVMLTSGADPGLGKGRGTPNQNGEKAKINDIHDLLNERSLRRLSSCSGKEWLLVVL